MKTPEGYEKDEIDRYLKSIGVYFIKPQTGGYGQSGHSDRIGCYQGRFFAIEVKREGKEPTKLQWKRIGEVAEAGGEPFWGTANKVISEFERWRAILPRS